MLLAGAGAREVTTVEYNPIASRWPGLRTLTPGQLAAAFLAGDVPVARGRPRAARPPLLKVLSLGRLSVVGLSWRVSAMLGSALRLLCKFMLGLHAKYNTCEHKHLIKLATEDPRALCSLRAHGRCGSLPRSMRRACVHGLARCTLHARSCARRWTLRSPTPASSTTAWAATATRWTPTPTCATWRCCPASSGPAVRRSSRRRRSPALRCEQGHVLTFAYPQRYPHRCPWCRIAAPYDKIMEEKIPGRAGPQAAWRAAGLLYLGVPFGADALVFNAHRIYGPVRLPMLAANFEVLGVVTDDTVRDLDQLWHDPPGATFSQPVAVLRNARHRPCRRTAA